MYKTRKYRILLDVQSAKVLKCYRNAYYYEFKRLILITTKRKITVKEISDDIHQASKWNLYKLVMNNKGKELNKAAIFNSNSVTFSRAMLTFYFGNSFIVDHLDVGVACDDDEWDELMKAKILRIDLFYQSEWYVNIILVERK